MEIRKNRLDWVAEENDITCMSEEDRRKMLGASD